MSTTYLPSSPEKIRFKCTQELSGSNINLSVTIQGYTGVRLRNWSTSGTIQIQDATGAVIETWTPTATWDSLNDGTYNVWVDIETKAFTIDRSLYSSIQIVPIPGGGRTDFAYTIYYQGTTYQVLYGKKGAQTLELLTPAYTLNITKGTGTVLTVTRTSSPYQGAPTSVLTNGAAIYYGDVIKVDLSAETGYNTNLLQVNGRGFTPGNSHTVAGNVSVVSGAEVKAYTLTITAGTGATITVTRTASPLKGAATGVLHNGDTIYYSDKITGTYSILTPYKATSATATAGWNTEVVVGRNIAYAVTTAVKSYTLHITENSHMTLTVTRSQSPYQGAATGQVSNNAEIYYGDKLKITFSSASGYEAECRAGPSTRELVQVQTGTVKDITSDYYIVCGSSPMATVHISNGTGEDTYLIYISDGSSYSLYQAYISNGSSWEAYY